MKNYKNSCLFYFPSTVLIIDNDSDFISELNEYLNEHQINTIPFAFTTSFLNYINNHVQPVSLNDFLHKENSYFSETTLSELYKIVYNPNRFNQISVLIIDYELPNITGTELCSLIKIPNIKKVILTNKASEKIAVEAFNQKIIDGFVFKEDLYNTLIDTITRLQYEYFFDISYPIHYLCNFKKEPFLKNLINIELHNFSPIEYYLLNKNGSFIMFDADLNASALFVEDSKYFDHMLLNKSILSNKIIDDLQNKKGIYVSNYISPLFKNIEMTIPCNKINGIFDDYFYAGKQNIAEIDVKNLISYKKRATNF